jgi:hypothetical protein
LVLRRLRACEQLDVCAVVRSSRVLDPTFGFVQGALGQIRRSGVGYALFLWCTTTLADWCCSWSAIGAVPARSADPKPRVLITRDINDAQGLQFVAESTPDLLVSAFFNQRLRGPALALPKHGCLNIHPSLLPEAKGVDPVFQALLNGAPLGVTVHFMTPELDAGGILAQRAIEARGGARVFEATALCFREGGERAGYRNRPCCGRRSAGSRASGAGELSGVAILGRGRRRRRAAVSWRGDRLRPECRAAVSTRGLGGPRLLVAIISIGETNAPSLFEVGRPTENRTAAEERPKAAGFCTSWAPKARPRLHPSSPACLAGFVMTTTPPPTARRVSHRNTCVVSSTRRWTRRWTPSAKRRPRMAGHRHRVPGAAAEKPRLAAHRCSREMGPQRTKKSWPRCTSAFAAATRRCNDLERRPGRGSQPRHYA